MRITILVIDSFGIGELPDAAKYGDVGSNTALHICENVADIQWPTLQAWGLGNASRVLGPDLPGCEAVENPAASFGVMAERSPGKDTTTGHWEMAGIILDKPFSTFPPNYPSFPPELVSAFEAKTGRKILGNKAASGTVIIQELGDEHVKTGNLICYTSSDSVFQIAAHEDVVPIDTLYEYCEIARELCDPYQVARVIARPFVGPGAGSYERTKRRRDFSIAMPDRILMEYLGDAGIHVVGIGKIGDIFNETGIAASHHDKGNPACLDRTLEVLSSPAPSGGEFVFVNLVDTDMVYGHRRDPQGYHDSVAATDKRLPELVDAMADGDVLIVTADHGCDPSYKGSDHTREHVPLLWYEKGAAANALGRRESFADLAQEIAARFGVGPMPHGDRLF